MIAGNFKEIVEKKEKCGIIFEIPKRRQL